MMMGDLVSGRRDRDQLIGRLAQDIKDTLSITVYEAGEVKRNRESARLAELRCNIFFYHSLHLEATIILFSDFLFCKSFLTALLVALLMRRLTGLQHQRPWNINC